MPVHKGDDAFRYDDRGDLIGPGVHVKRDELILYRGMVVTAETLTKIYKLGVLAGKMEEAELHRKAKERIDAAKLALSPED